MVSTVISSIPQKTGLGNGHHNYNFCNVKKCQLCYIGNGHHTAITSVTHTQSLYYIEL